MNAHEAADKIRPTFHLHSMPPEDRRHVKFVEDVADELEVEHTPFNLQQIDKALADANIHEDSNEYPKMLYSRTYPDSDFAGTFDPRHDHVWVKVENEDEQSALGSTWVENISDLPPRGDLPLYPEAKSTVEPLPDPVLESIPEPKPTVTI